MSNPPRLSDTSSSDPFEAGRAALARGDWREAYTYLEALRAIDSPEALECLGMAAWGLNDATTMFDARERAFRLYRQRGDRQGAARVAINLANDYFFTRGEYAVASGWLQRARRLLQDAEPCSELGWLAVVEAQLVGWADHDFSRVQQRCAEAVALGQALGDVDLEMVALACEGLALVSQGEIGEGMRRLDEAALAAAVGEMSDVDAANTACCCLLFACEWTRDYVRAAQWIERLRGLAVRWGHPTLFAFCRTHYAGVLVWRGDWAQAEAELESAIAELEATQPALAAEALVRLADLRCRQGRFDASEALLDRAEAPPFRALVGDFCLIGRAALAFARDDLDSAIELVERFLRAIPVDDRMERFSGLELLSLALTLRGDHDRASTVLAELRAVAASVGTKPMHASVRFVEGWLAATAQQHDTARRCFEDAADLWSRSGAPYESAQARLGLAQSLLALGRIPAAAEHARDALDVLVRLDARPDIARAQALIGEIESTGRTRRDEPRGVDVLTPREREVLSLIAAGKSNQEIARQLVLSLRTVERHISNIYSKIGASGATARAAATAFALRHGHSPGA